MAFGLETGPDTVVRKKEGRRSVPPVSAIFCQIRHSQSSVRIGGFRSRRMLPVWLLSSLLIPASRICSIRS